MFVIADQRARWIGRECCFSCATEAKEDRSVYRVVCGVIGRAVHRHDPGLWQ